MVVHLPVEVAGGSFVDRRGNAGEVGGDVVFESVFADVAQKFLQAQDFHHPRTTEGVQWIVGEAAAARVTANGAVGIVGGEAREAHRAGFH